MVGKILLESLRTRSVAKTVMMPIKVPTRPNERVIVSLLETVSDIRIRLI